MSVGPDSKVIPEEKMPVPQEGSPTDLPPLEDLRKGRWERSWATIACGAGLFSDGYLNGVCTSFISSGTRHLLFHEADDITSSLLTDLI